MQIFYKYAFKILRVNYPEMYIYRDGLFGEKCVDKEQSWSIFYR